MSPSSSSTPPAQTTDQRPSDSETAQVQSSEAESTSASHDFDRRFALFREHMLHAWANIQSGSDSYDQSLLTVSSGALALSLAFIKDVVPLKEAHYMWMLFASWFAFASCILSVIASYRQSVKVQIPAIEEARRVLFSEECDEPENEVEKRRIDKARTTLTFLNNCSGADFHSRLLAYNFVCNHQRRTGDQKMNGGRENDLQRGRQCKTRPSADEKSQARRKQSTGHQQWLKYWRQRRQKVARKNDHRE